MGSGKLDPYGVVSLDVPPPIPVDADAPFQDIPDYPEDEPLTEEEIAEGRRVHALNEAVAVHRGTGNNPETVLYTAKAFYKYLKEG